MRDGPRLHPGRRRPRRTGADRYRDHSPFPVQQEWFDRHLELARSSGLPVVIHCRNCDQEIIDQLARSGGPVRGILHSFTGTWDQAQAFLELVFISRSRGWLRSRTGTARCASRRGRPRSSRPASRRDGQPVPQPAPISRRVERAQTRGHHGRLPRRSPRDHADGARRSHHDKRPDPLSTPNGTDSVARSILGSRAGTRLLFVG